MKKALTDLLLGKKRIDKRRLTPDEKVVLADIILARREGVPLQVLADIAEEEDELNQPTGNKESTTASEREQAEEEELPDPTGIDLATTERLTNHMSTPHIRLHVEGDLLDIDTIPRCLIS